MYILIHKFNIYVICWLVVFLELIGLLENIIENDAIIAVIFAIAAAVWFWLPFKLIRDGRKKLKELAGMKDE